MHGQMKIFRVGSHQFRESLRELLREFNSGLRIAQVVRRHSENGLWHSENYFLSSESCSENTPERSQSEQLEWRHLFYIGVPKSSKDKKNLLRTFPLVPGISL